MAEEAKEEELEYESDPEETKLSLKMRRREASDDEEEEGGDGGDSRGRDKLKPRRRIADSDVESDGQGAAAEYEDEEEDYVEEEDEEIIDEDEYIEDLEGEEYLEERRGERGEVEAVAEGPEALAEGRKESGEDRLGPKSIDGLQGSHDDGDFSVGANENHQQAEEVEEEGEKKENEPFAVPTAGAFYMHDDRFRDNAGGRNRRTFGGRKLWESKDDKKWGHDKFEELTMQERHFDEGRRNSRGRYRGRGRNRGAERGGYVRGNRPRTYNSNNNNQNSNAPKSVRGRGPRRYQPSFKSNNEVPTALNQRSGKTAEKPSHSNSGRVSAPTSNLEPEAAPATKLVFASSLNSASPPFYPSASTSTSKEIAPTQKRDVQTGANNRRIHPSVVDESFSTTHSGAVQRGKSVVDSIGMDKLYINDSINTVAAKPSTSLQFQSLSMSSSQTLPVRAQGRGITSLPKMTYQSTRPNSQVNKFSPPIQLHSSQRNPVQNQGQPSLQASGQQFEQNPEGGSQVSSAKVVLSKSSFESGEMESPSESNKSKAALVAKGKGSGRGSFLYGGAQVIGASGSLGSGPGDQNFPAFLPVMQFRGQHPGGIGVPAVGMAFPGYVGGGNSEMTWLPVLAGAAGALGATYCSPYLSMDGSYPARPSGQASAVAAASVKENNADKPNNEWNSSERPGITSDDYVQRQKNPRRYTEMKFDQ